ncbi:hypothetical protein BDB00DRAFT_881862 [Zychaea mexicana]|uniref:uncharacterized protein n=1 Tax=Zychaea mexicana TaxID=64656 RepID=UPI0022FF2B93|nr:uncharacterized protein BDB00DRAFT_881862 [Zychaea mexicana]KAI9497110.1 hypothetical protein BDB00DRAFT_881862 [Zychaea mexicana]
MQQDGGLRRSSIIQHEQEADEPTVFTTPLDDNKDDDDDDDNDEQTAIKTKKKKHHKKRAHLCFKSPLQRGQTLTFSLQNVTPDDHIIVFKFLTSNARLQRARSRRHSLMERYFVRPSAGRMIATDQMDIMLFLNHVPGELAPNEILKDKILVRWAVIQRNTQVDAWIQAQPDSTRRKWLEMLVEQWPDQVIVRETRLKIRFM